MAPDATTPVPVNTGSPAIPDAEGLQILIDCARERKMLPASDTGSDLITAAIFDRVLQASSQDEISAMAEASLPGWGEELENVPVDLLSFRANPSDYFSPKDPMTGLPYYLICQVARLDTGETVSVATGSTNVVAAILSAASRGEIPLRKVKVVHSRKPTRSGYSPEWLVSA